MLLGVEREFDLEGKWKKEGMILSVVMMIIMAQQQK